MEKINYPKWSDLLALIGVFIVASIAAGMLALGAQALFKFSDGFMAFCGYTAGMAATIIFAIMQRRNRLGKDAPKLNFSFRPTSLGVVVWGAIMTLAVAIAVEPLVALFPDIMMDLLAETLGKGIWALVTSVIAASILEEILFRGIIQESVTTRLGGVRGILVSSLIFGAIHIIPQQAVNAFFAGLVIGYVYHITRSLMPVIILHALNNGISSLIYRISGESVEMTVAELVKNPTLYAVIYSMAAALIVISAIAIYRKAGKRRPEEPEEDNNIEAPSL